MSEFINKGGPFVYLIGLLLVIGLAASVAQIVWGRRARFPGLLVGIVATALGAGILGILDGLELALAAAVQTEAAERDRLMAVASAVALLSGVAALFTAAILLPFHTIASLQAPQGPLSRVGGFGAVLSAMGLFCAALGGIASVQLLITWLDGFAFVAIGEQKAAEGASIMAAVNWIRGRFLGWAAFGLGAAGAALGATEGWKWLERERGADPR